MTDVVIELAVVVIVREFEEASRQARAWMKPGTCCPGTSSQNPCQRPSCIARAEHYSYTCAREAGHLANRLLRYREWPRLERPEV